MLHDGEGQERHLPPALDGRGHLALVAGAVARDPAGDDLVRVRPAVVVLEDVESDFGPDPI